MRYRARFLAALVAPALLLTAATSAAGASVIEDYARVINSRHAGATFVQVDGCTQTEVFISASDSVFGARPGPVNKQGLTGVFYAERDICAEEGPRGFPIVYSADGMSLDSLGSAPQFGTAWLQVSIPAMDRDGNGVQIDLDLEWSATEPFERSRVTGNDWFSNRETKGARVHTFSHGLAAAAVASGSVTVGGNTVELAVTTDATLQQTRYFCQVIQHPQGGAEVDC